MPIIFYDHLIDKRDVLLIIDSSNQPENHKGKMRQLVDDIIHQGIVEFILQKLHPHHHNTFLNRLDSVPYDPELINYLKDHASADIEILIQEHSKKLLDQIREDLKQ